MGSFHLELAVISGSTHALALTLARPEADGLLTPPVHLGESTSLLLPSGSKYGWADQQRHDAAMQALVASGQAAGLQAGPFVLWSDLHPGDHDPATDAPGRWLHVRCAQDDDAPLPPHTRRVRLPGNGWRFDLSLADAPHLDPLVRSVFLPDPAATLP